MSDAKVAERVRLALDMYEFGEKMYLANLRRRNPLASPAEIAAELQAWRESKPPQPGHLGIRVATPSQ